MCERDKTSDDFQHLGFSYDRPVIKVRSTGHQNRSDYSHGLIPPFGTKRFNFQMNSTSVNHEENSQFFSHHFDRDSREKFCENMNGYGCQTHSSNFPGGNSFGVNASGASSFGVSPAGVNHTGPDIFGVNSGVNAFSAHSFAGNSFGENLSDSSPFEVSSGVNAYGRNNFDVNVSSGSPFGDIPSREHFDCVNPFGVNVSGVNSFGGNPSNVNPFDVNSSGINSLFSREPSPQLQSLYCSGRDRRGRCSSETDHVFHDPISEMNPIEKSKVSWLSSLSLDPLRRFAVNDNLNENDMNGRLKTDRSTFGDATLSKGRKEREDALLSTTNKTTEMKIDSTQLYDSPTGCTLPVNVPVNNPKNQVPLSFTHHEINCPELVSLLNDDEMDEKKRNLKHWNPTDSLNYLGFEVTSSESNEKDCLFLKESVAEEEGKEKVKRRITKPVNSVESRGKKLEREDENSRTFFDPKRIFASVSKRKTKNELSSTQTSSEKQKSSEIKTSFDEEVKNFEKEADREPRETETNIPNDKTSQERTKIKLNNDSTSSYSYCTGTLDWSQYINNDLSDARKRVNQSNLKKKTDKKENFPEASGVKRQDMNNDNKKRDHSHRTGHDNQDSDLPTPDVASDGPGHFVRKGRGQPVRDGNGTREDHGLLRNDESVHIKTNNSKHEKKNKKKEEELKKNSLFSKSIDLEKLKKSAAWAGYEILTVLINVIKLILGIILNEVTCLLSYVCSVVCHGINRFSDWLRTFFQKKKKESADYEDGKKFCRSGLRRKFLSENIILPESGEEAIRRLFACDGKDPYSILGLKVDCTDEEIRKYYRRQAVLVHPDKSSEPGAEEAFKILNRAFEMIGEPDKRRIYDAEAAVEHNENVAMHEFADLLSKLHETMKEAMNWMGCSSCGGKHKRLLVDIQPINARYCLQCDCRHSAREGDVWAESNVFGFYWKYYACMEGSVYDVTEWASCQKDNFKNVPANSHVVLVHINTGKNRQQRTAARDAESELKEFVDAMYAQANGEDMNGKNTFNSRDNGSGWKQQNNNSKRKRKKRK